MRTNTTRTTETKRTMNDRINSRMAVCSDDSYDFMTYALRLTVSDNSPRKNELWHIVVTYRKAEAKAEEVVGKIKVTRKAARALGQKMDERIETKSQFKNALTDFFYTKMVDEAYYSKKAAKDLDSKINEMFFANIISSEYTNLLCVNHRKDAA